jgi:TolA-binding protein
MMMRLKFTYLTLMLLLLTACAWRGEEVVIPASNKVSADPDSRENALINLDLATVEAEPSELSGIELRQLRNDYVDLVPLVEELSNQSNTELSWRGLLNQEIRNRLADIEMLLAEEAQADGTPLTEGDSYYRIAIQSYQTLLEENKTTETPLDPIAEENLLYQLARAFSLQGEEEQSLQYSNQLLRKFPFSKFSSELHFRQGEFYYNRNDYTQAIKFYRKVIEGAFDPYAPNGRSVNLEDPFYPMAAYMLGWAHFKREEYTPAIGAFEIMLDVSLAPDEYTQAHKPIEDLGLSQQKLVEDSLDMMALMFASEGGAIAINAYYFGEDEKPYTYMVYNALAQQFLDDSRFRDSANTFLAFARNYPTHHQAITFYIKHIDAYILGEFPAEVLPAKRRFVESYGLNGSDWQGYASMLTEQALPYLEQYISELAQFEHSLAQQSLSLLAELPVDDNGDEVESRRDSLNATKLKAFQQAERWYREYIATFGPNEETADMQFYLAESLMQAEQYELAILEYEILAYDYPQHPQAANAAYTALLAHQYLPAEIRNDGRLSALQNSQIRFLDRFPGDSRAVDVGLQLSQDLYTGQLYFDAVTWSTWLLEQGVTDEDWQTAMLVRTQSQFELKDYANAQLGYQALLDSPQINSDLQAELTDKLAATYYQEAQIALQAAPSEVTVGGELTLEQSEALSLAVDKLLLVVAKAPQSAIAINAKYDAAAYLLQLSSWQKGIQLLLEFEQENPQHPLTSGITEKLIVAYERSEQWLLASERLIDLWNENQSLDIGREALYLAAEYADKAGARDIALPHFRNYAHTYPEPVALADEARYKMSEYYLASGEEQKRRFWLEKLILSYEQQAGSASDRIRYLAAMSKSVFADDAYFAYLKVNLTLPLDQSIKAKRKAMQRVIDLNQEIINYRVAEFTTKAGFRLADAYASLANALYDSERPPELDALALEQYDILLEEQAYPFEEQAIAIHTTNTERSWQGSYDQWVKSSFDALATLLPAKFNKPELHSEVDYAAF